MSGQSGQGSGCLIVIGEAAAVYGVGLLAGAIFGGGDGLWWVTGWTVLGLVAAILITSRAVPPWRRWVQQEWAKVNTPGRAATSPIGPMVLALVLVAILGVASVAVGPHWSGNGTSNSVQQRRVDDCNSAFDELTTWTDNGPPMVVDNDANRDRFVNACVAEQERLGHVPPP